MTLSRELMLAILSMDSYNRGYGFGVAGFLESGQLGGATIRAFEEDEQQGWEAAGFYAIAYDMTGVSGFADGERVISYRGSDYQDTRGFPSVLSNDVWQGWTNAVGYPFGGQPRLALDFYRAVTGTEPYNTPGNYTITGHSLGGSLAGFVSALSGNQAVLFDHIPFGVAANNNERIALEQAA